jgi:NhaP-type Na+/H+ or K+/H+ antiporter
MQVALFGTVGASVMFDRVESSMIGGGVLIIICGVCARWVATFMCGHGQNFTVKERAFMGFAWIPKATVQAAIGGVILSEAEKHPEMTEF